MTALKKFLRLESTGLWRDAPEDQRREVVVTFGDSSLVLSDPKTDLALSHWSLPAVERLNHGEMPAIYAPGRQSSETLEIGDPDMITALDTVRSALAAARPKPGKLRDFLVGGAAMCLLALAVFWLPGALITYTAKVVPPAKRAEIGQAALDEVVRVTGAPCSGALGQRSLAVLADRLFGPVDTPILLVMREGIAVADHLPGKVILLSRSLAERQDGPQALAGAALAEAARAAAIDPLVPLLQHAGLVSTLRLLATGDLPDAALDGYGEAILRTPPVPVSTASLIAGFRAAGVPAAPYAFAVDAAGNETAQLIAQDPYPDGATAPLIPDDAWVSLQAICN